MATINMVDQIVQFLNQFPRELAVIILSALPITELRLSLPIALQVWHLSIPSAFIYSVIGNLIPLIPLYFGLNWLRLIVQKYMPWATKFIDSSIARAEQRVKDDYVKYGAVALCIFTAIPLPLTGLWSAVLAAVALKIPFKYAAPSIAFGVVIAGIVVTIITVSTRVAF